MSLPKSLGEPVSAMPPRSASRAFILESATPASISLLSLSIISTGVFLGASGAAHRRQVVTPQMGILSSSMPNSFGPRIRRSVVDQLFLYAALPPTLIPSIGLPLPIGGQHLPCRLLEVVALVSAADCMIRAAERVIAVSARGENVLLQARDVGHVISLRPFESGTARRPVDLEEKVRIELQPRILVPCVPSAIGHKLAITRYRRPLRQAVLHMVQQYLRDRYLETIRLRIGWNLHCVEQLFEGCGLLRFCHVALKKRSLLVRQQTKDVR
jgi:hypothetical protein